MSNRSYLVEQPRDPSRPWAPSPFKRLARTHALSVAGDAMFTTAMASLVFFNVSDLGQARWRVAMALIFTILPFSMAAPFIGPLIDRARGGRKWMIVALSAGRALVCALLVWDRNTPWALYPQFLFALVFAKGYVIAKGALVPTTVHNDAELVQANAKLAAISGVAAVAGGAPSLLVMWIASKLGSDHGPDFALAIATVVYVLTAIQAAQLPSVRIADEPADEAEITELRTAGIRHAAQAISLTRGTVGFLTFMLAFHFKNLESFDSTASKIGLVGSVVGGQLGFMVGAAIAPPIRRQLSEERMLMVSLGTITVAGLLTALMGELAGATLLAFGVGITSNTAKQAFDAIVQRDAPDANRGRAFARFETRFQLVWVTGALIPVAIAMPIKLGFLLIAVCCGTALTLYYVGLHRAVAESKRRPSPLAGEPVLVEPQPASRSFLRRRPSIGANAVSAARADDAFGGDRTLVSTPPGERVLAPSGIDSTMVVAPATVAAAPMGPGRAADPAYDHTWVQAPGGVHPDPTLDAGSAPTTPDGAGLFGAPDSPIPASLVDVPTAGLFSGPAAPALPVLPSTPLPPLPAVASPDAQPPALVPGRAGDDVAGPVGLQAPFDRSGAPGWPEAPPDAPAPMPGPASPAGWADPTGAADPVGHAGVDPGVGWSDADPGPVADPTAAVAPPAASGAVFYDGSSWIDEDDPSVDDLPVVPRSPGFAAPAPDVGGPDAPRPPASTFATPVGAAGTVPFVNPDGSYPEPPWRDTAPTGARPDPGQPAPAAGASGTPPLPGFEARAGGRTPGRVDDRDPARPASPDARGPGAG